MRHQARLVGDQALEIGVDHRRVERGKAETLEFRNGGEQAAHCLAEAGCTWQVAAIGAEIDAGQHQLAAAAFDQGAGLGGDLTQRHAAVITAAIGDDAEGAAVVAAVLHLDEGACAALEAGDQMRRGGAHRHDVVDRNRRGIARQKTRGMELFGVADHAVDLGHGGVTRGIDLCGAAGDDDAGLGVGAPCAPDRLARLALGFRRHRAGVEDHRALKAGGSGMAAHDFRFEGVQAAAEGDDFGRAHSSKPLTAASP